MPFIGLFCVGWTILVVGFSFNSNNAAAMTEVGNGDKFPYHENYQQNMIFKNGNCIIVRS